MNNDRRKAIRALYKEAEELRKLSEDAKEAVKSLQLRADELRGDIQNILDEEQEYLDNLPQNLQGGEKSSAAEEAIAHLDEAINSIDEMCGIEFDFDIDQVLENLDNAENSGR